MDVDPAVMTCYPTSQTVAVQNEYTRVICEYLPLLLLLLQPCPCGLPASVSLSGRPLVPQSSHVAPNLRHHTTSGVPYASPIYSSLAPDPTKSGHLASPTQTRAEYSIKAPFYQPRSAAVPYRTSPRCPPTLLSTFDRAPDPTLRSLSMGASLLSPSPISTLHCNIISVRVVSLPRVLGSLNHTI